MLMQLSLGVMSIAAMIVVAAVIAAEKPLFGGNAIAKIVGVVAIIAGLTMGVRAAID